MSLAGKLQLATDEILSRMENSKKLTGSSIRLRTELIKLIKKQVRDIQKVKQERNHNMATLKKLITTTEKDNKLLLENKLTPDNSSTLYKDTRIFGVKIPAHLKKILATERTRNICLFHKLIELTDFCDKELALDMAKGFQSLGRHPRTMIWPYCADADKPANEKLSQFTHTTAEQKKVKQVKPDWMEDEVIDSILNDILEDQKIGRFVECNPQDTEVPSMLAFGIRQKGKIRQLVDSRKRNKFNSFPEKIKLQGTRLCVEAIATFFKGTADGSDDSDENESNCLPSSQSKRDIFERVDEQAKRRRASPCTTKCKEPPRPITILEKIKTKARAANAKLKKRKGLAPSARTKDFKKAYFQVGISNPHQNLARAWSNSDNKWRFFQSAVLDMGNNLSVPSWLRIVEAAMHFGCVLLLIVFLTYIDDSMILCVEEDNDDTSDAFDLLMTGLGIVMSPKAASNQNSREKSTIEHLGLNWSFEGHKTSILIPEEKRLATLEMIDQLITQTDEKQVCHKLLEKAIGNVCFIACSRHDRAGIQVLRPLYSLIHKDQFDEKTRSRENRKRLKVTLQNTRRLVEEHVPITLSHESATKPFIWLFLDASTNGGKDGGPVIGAILVDEQGCLHSTKIDSDLPPGRVIDAYEALGVNLGIESFAPLTEGKQLICHVDNAAGCYALVKCSHKSIGISKITTESILRLRTMATPLVVDFILSEENIADWLTRHELEQILDMLPDVTKHPPRLSSPFQQGAELTAFADKFLACKTTNPKPTAAKLPSGTRPAAGNGNFSADWLAAEVAKDANKFVPR